MADGYGSHGNWKYYKDHKPPYYEGHSDMWIFINGTLMVMLVNPEPQSEVGYNSNWDKVEIRTNVES